MFEKAGVQNLESLDGTGLTILIVHARWNIEVISKLVQAATDILLAKNARVIVRTVPGAYELPFASKTLMESNPELDACISIGVLIKGSTMHFEYICGAVSSGLMDVQLEVGRPVVFGVLTCLNEQQAIDRAGGEDGTTHNHGDDWGRAAIEMALLAKNARIALNN